jgi:hypothetical protein
MSYILLKGRDIITLTGKVRKNIEDHRKFRINQVIETTQKELNTRKWWWPFGRTLFMKTLKISSMKSILLNALVKVSLTFVITLIVYLTIHR